MKPIVYMLCGLTGSGKTTYAHELEQQGAVRLSIDEEVHALHERDGIPYPEKFLDYEPEAKAAHAKQLEALIAEGKSVILDYGFWKKADRDKYKQLITSLDADWKLLYFKSSPEQLMDRLHGRNKRDGANALTVTEDMLRDFIARFEEPSNEGEEIIQP